MSLKLKHGMILLVLALCALIGIASAAGGGIGGEAKTEIGIFDESSLNVAAFDDEVDNGDEIDEEEVINEECNEDEECDEEVAIEIEPVDTSIEGQLLAAAEVLSENWSAAEMEEVMENIYNNADGVIMVYVITPRGIVEAVYPDEYNAAVGDFIGRSPVGGILMKAREFTKTDEYTSAREKIDGYDVIQPVITSDDEYLGAIVAKLSN